jgi:hypothetical protein
LWHTRDEFEELFKEVKWIKKAVDREISQVTFTCVGYLGYSAERHFDVKNLPCVMLVIVVVHPAVFSSAGHVWLSGYHIRFKTELFFAVYFLS